MPSAVATPDSIMSQRTRTRTRAFASCWAGSTGASAPDGGKVMAETPEEEQIEHVTVGTEEAGERLDRVLAAHVTALSRTRLKALVLAGRVAIGGRTICDPGHHVNAGDQ